MTVRLEGRGLTRRLTDPEPFTLVDAASLTVAAGELVAIVGPSGCGKSSLLYLLGLLDRPDAGEVLIDGRITTALSDAARTRLRLEHIGFVFQFHFLLPELTAGANIALPMRRLSRLSEAQIAARVADLCAKLDLSGLEVRRPDRLSGGQRQRVAIARALANDPALLLCDEPTGNLDSLNTRRVIEEFQRLAHEEGRAVICVTHNEGFAKTADRCVHMLDGRIVESSAADLAPG